MTTGPTEFGSGLTDRSVRAARVGARAMLDALAGNEEHAERCLASFKRWRVGTGRVAFEPIAKRDCSATRLEQQIVILLAQFWRDSLADD